MALRRNPAVQEPSLEELRSISQSMGLKCSEEELATSQAYCKRVCQSYQRVYDLTEDPLPVKYPRLPGHREQADPAWGWYRAVSGRTLAIKDNIAVAGVPMTCGSKWMDGYIPEFDATVVTRILDAGGRIPGKSSCEDMCTSGSSWTSTTGVVPYPYDPTRTSGGSSSGSAALVARGVVDTALGSDQGGSIRIPAAWCGLVGLKPTFGLVPYTGCSSLESTIDHVGPMTRKVEDCALAIAGYDNGLDPRQHRDSTVPKYSNLLDASLAGERIGVLKEGFEGVDTEVCHMVNSAISRLKEGGATVEEVSKPLHNDGKAIWMPIAYETRQETFLKDSGVGSGWKGFYPVSMAERLTMGARTRSYDISSPLKTVMMFGGYIEENYQNKFYAKAQNLSRVLTKAYDEKLRDYNVLVMPTVPSKPYKLPTEEDSLADTLHLTTGMGKNLTPFNVTGHPALSINASYTDGLPCGMMFVGRMFDDLRVLQIAKCYEDISKSASEKKTYSYIIRIRVFVM